MHVEFFASHVENMSNFQPAPGGVFKKFYLKNRIGRLPPGLQYLGPGTSKTKRRVGVQNGGFKGGWGGVVFVTG
jgi:hypothetical protein